MKAILYEQVIRAALDDGNTMDGTALEYIVKAAAGKLRRGMGQRKPVDLSPASTRTELCAILEEGVRASLAAAPGYCRSGDNDPEYRALWDRKRALYEFARAAHAVIDFYFLTNWVEIARVGNRAAPTQPMLVKGRTVRPGALPSTLSVGAAKDS